MNRNANEAPISFLLMRKDFRQQDGHSSDLDQKRSGILFMIENHMEMGQSRRTDDDKIWRKRTPSFPCYESIVPRNAQKQRWWEIINTLLR